MAVRGEIDRVSARDAAIGAILPRPRPARGRGRLVAEGGRRIGGSRTLLAPLEDQARLILALAALTPGRR